MNTLDTSQASWLAVITNCRKNISTSLGSLQLRKWWSKLIIIMSGTSVARRLQSFLPTKRQKSALCHKNLRKDVSSVKCIKIAPNHGNVFVGRHIESKIMQNSSRAATQNFQNNKHGMENFSSVSTVFGQNRLAELYAVLSSIFVRLAFCAGQKYLRRKMKNLPNTQKICASGNSVLNIIFRYGAVLPGGRKISLIVISVNLILLPKTLPTRSAFWIEHLDCRTWRY